MGQFHYYVCFARDFAMRSISKLSHYTFQDFKARKVKPAKNFLYCRQRFFGHFGFSASAEIVYFACIKIILT